MTLKDQDRQRIIEILSASFDNNQSVAYIIPMKSRAERIKGLMKYACQVCERYGVIVLSKDKNACALVLLPHTKRFSVEGIYLDLKFILSVIGIGNLRRVLSRESLIKKQHPNEPFYYLWFIGVDPAITGQGLGTGLMKQLIEDAVNRKLPFYLETSTLQNLPWYQKMGFQTYYKLTLTYQLNFMKRSI